MIHFKSKKRFISLSQVLAIVFISFVSLNTEAATTNCQVVNSGLWSNVNTWSCDTGSGLPETDTYVQILTPYSVTMDTDVSILRILLGDGASLVVENNPNGLTFQWSAFVAELGGGSIELQGDLTFAPAGSFLSIVLGTIEGAFDLDVTAHGGITFSKAIGQTTPLSNLTATADSSITIAADITTSGIQTYNDELAFTSNAILKADDVIFSENVYSDSNTLSGFDLTIDADAIFNANVGSISTKKIDENNVFLAAQININNLTITKTATVNTDGNIVVDGNLVIDRKLTLNTNTTLSSSNGGNITLNGSGGAYDFTINTPGKTYLNATIGNPRHTSLTTNGNGDIKLASRDVKLLVDGSSAVTFNDDLIFGPSAEFVIDQAGSGDLIFNGNLLKFSGGQKILHVNDVSGQTIFNGSVNLGQINTNDGSGEDITVINHPTFITDQGGSNNGVMTFNDPVRIMQDLVISETDSGQIIFNNSIDAGDGLFDIDLTIESDNEVILGPIGSLQSFATITTDAGGSSSIRGHVLANTSILFNDDVKLVDVTLVSSESPIFNGEIDLQEFNISLSAIDANINGVVSGTGDLISSIDGNLYLNAENTYSGSTKINNGQLNLSSAISNNNISSSTQIELSLGTVLIPNTINNKFDLASSQTLSGEGSITGELLTSSGSILSPGSSIGQFSGDRLEMFTGSTYHIEVNGLNSGVNSDLLSFNMIDLDSNSTGGSNLSISTNTSMNIGDKVIIINNIDINDINGTFNGLTEGETFGGLGNALYSVSYVGGNGNDVELTVIDLCASEAIINNNSDSGIGSLRNAIADLCDGGSISFSADMNITLNNEIIIDKVISINSGGYEIELSGNNSNRIFNIASSGNLSVSSIAFTDGFTLNGGGAITNAGVLNASSTTFHSNTSSHNTISGGAILNQASATTILKNSTFFNNSGIFGGAIYNTNNATDGVLIISNSTFTQNGSNAIQGGGIFNGGEFQSFNNTFAANGAVSTIGSSLYTENGSQQLYNTIIADGISDDDCHIVSANSSENNTTSLIETGNCDASLTVDPQLQTLSNNGGNTLTIALTLDSPAVDSGSDELCTTMDQRGIARPLFDSCDIGAYETEFLAVIYVAENNVNQGFDCYLGACWETAYGNLQDALEVAGQGSEIWIKEGVYIPDVGINQTNDDPSSTFDIPSGVSLFGGFIGGEAEKEQRDLSNNLTILSGDIDENDNNGDGNQIAESISEIRGTNTFNIIRSNGDFVIDGLTITAGFADGISNDQSHGGGIQCNTFEDDNRLINNIHWVGNYAENGGGALYNCNGIVINSIFSSNESNSLGGAIETSFDLSLSNVSYINNFASNNGGAIYARNLFIDRNYFSSNESDYFGGAIFVENEIDMSNSVFTGNYAGESGGALYLINQGYVNNVTFSGNEASDEGGAIYHNHVIQKQGTENLNIVNSIIWNNADTNGTGTISSGILSLSGVAISHSILQGSGGSTNWDVPAGIDGGNNIDMDPGFIEDVSLNSLPNVSGNVRLSNGSVAVNTGNNNLITTLLDLDGNKRILGTVVDMGAHEQIDSFFKDGFED